MEYTPTETNTFRLAQVLMVYAHSNSYYLELHQVHNDEIMEGHPLTREAARKVWESCYEQAKEHEVRTRGILPLNLLYNDVGRLIWHIPAGKHNLNFSKQLHLPSGLAHCPALLWVYDSKLSVYALKSDKRPDEKTKLYQAPFHNIYAEGRVCMGSSSMPSRNQPLEMFLAGMEQAFWQSEFSHVLGHSLGEEVNLNSFWKRMVETGEKFPDEVLIDAQKTVGDLIL